MEKIYWPYYRKDWRQHIIIKSNWVKRTVSYPKYIVEKHYNIKLTEVETIDHINNNFDDNRIENLRIISRKKHNEEDVLRNKDVKCTCSLCWKIFIVDGKKVNNRRSKFIFCSKKCSCTYWTIVQYGKKVDLKESDLVKEKYRLKDLNNKHQI